MKIAVTVWGNRVSPVFDAAKTLLVVEIENRVILKKQYLSFDPSAMESLVRLLKQMQVSVVICGAITASPADRILRNQIRLISFVSGDAMECIEVLAEKQMIDPSRKMPGCIVTDTLPDRP